MKKRNRFLLRGIVLGVIALALGGAAYTAYMSDDSPVQEGDRAPDFTLTNLAGDEVRLSDYQGQGVFLNFWATWCGPCKEEMPDMQEQYELQNEHGVEILAVNIAEGELVVSQFQERYGLTFPIVLDTDRSVSRQYGIQPIPTSYFIDAEQTVVGKYERMLSAEEIAEKMQNIQP